MFKYLSIISFLDSFVHVLEIFCDRGEEFVYSEDSNSSILTISVIGNTTIRYQDFIYGTRIKDSDVLYVHVLSYDTFKPYRIEMTMFGICGFDYNYWYTTENASVIGVSRKVSRYIFSLFYLM